MGKALQRLAQAHVVAEDAARAQLAQRLHPDQALLLVGPQFASEPGWSRAGPDVRVAQARGELTQSFTAFPLRCQAVEPGQARAVGLAHTQRWPIHLLAHVELTEGRQNRLDASQRQRHVQRLLVVLSRPVQLHAQLLLIATQRDGARAEQLRVLADQPQQDRQHADALPVDDDAEIEIEPVVIS